MFRVQELTPQSAVPVPLIWRRFASHLILRAVLIFKCGSTFLERMYKYSMHAVRLPPKMRSQRCRNVALYHDAFDAIAGAASEVARLKFPPIGAKDRLLGILARQICRSKCHGAALSTKIDIRSQHPKAKPFSAFSMRCSFSAFQASINGTYMPSMSCIGALSREVRELPSIATLNFASNSSQLAPSTQARRVMQSAIPHPVPSMHTLFGEGTLLPTTFQIYSDTVP